MKKLGYVLLPMLAVALMLAFASANAVAQNVGDNSVYFVTYFSNANTAKAPDATIRVINDGDTGANLWAAFYVFDDSQELSECGACQITPDGLDSQSVNKELTANPLTGRALSRGVIKVISSSTSDPTATKPTAGLRGWTTHIQAGATAGTFNVTETLLADSNLSAGEKTLLQNLCYYAQILGSGTGVISCTPEDHDF
jgi:hypothetical protein